MSKRKTGEPSSKPNRRPSVTLYARIDPALGSAFRAYVESIRPRTDTQSVIELLIEQHLTEKGLWPPAEPGQ